MDALGPQAVECRSNGDTGQIYPRRFSTGVLTPAQRVKSIDSKQLICEDKLTSSADGKMDLYTPDR